MGDLLDFAVEAHGGLKRWCELRTVTAHLANGGVVFPLKGQAGVLDDITVQVDLHRQFTSHAPFGEPGLRTAFRGEHVAIENEAGEVVAERDHTRASFAGHTLESKWDRLQTAYFAGYAMWTYLTTPFTLMRPGFRTEELDPWHEDGETWRRLRVEFPDDITTHNKVQTFYFDSDGLIRRHDYDAEMVAGGLAAHYSTDHREVDGIVVPTRRRVYTAGEDGRPVLEPLLVSIDLDDIRFA
ncbi:hypothetical protein VSH64_26730 [Amycolatopsis rhabdoformis]|uniref:Uncharacterized protein n=1 Tax=Amycolatopsis rhabdoformis TaxID=1448059 RepID=A0ABZ1HW81_9PSEU|nr:hypothetical protein [Amycolatopsis rhabdoformis]WSE26475.1 hypothetical protein VSH64_26730 [Amycolatopsis rhabdoformis]